MDLQTTNNNFIKKEKKYHDSVNGVLNFHGIFTKHNEIDMKEEGEDFSRILSEFFEEEQNLDKNLDKIWLLSKKNSEKLEEKEKQKLSVLKDSSVVLGNQTNSSSSQTQQQAPQNLFSFLSKLGAPPTQEASVTDSTQSSSNLLPHLSETLDNIQKIFKISTSDERIFTFSSKNKLNHSLFKTKLFGNDQTQGTEPEVEEEDEDDYTSEDYPIFRTLVEIAPPTLAEDSKQQSRSSQKPQNTTNPVNKRKKVVFLKGQNPVCDLLQTNNEKSDKSFTFSWEKKDIESIFTRILKENEKENTMLSIFPEKYSKNNSKNENHQKIEEISEMFHKSHKKGSKIDQDLAISETENTENERVFSFYQERKPEDDIKELIFSGNDLKFLFPSEKNLPRQELKHKLLTILSRYQKIPKFETNSSENFNFPFQNLASLNLSANYLHSVPVELSSLKNLQKLDLSFNFISKIKKNSISELKLLKILKLNHNKLKNFEIFGENSTNSSNLLNFSILEHVDLSDNQLCSIPNDISNFFPNLEFFDISNNSFFSNFQKIYQKKSSQSKNSSKNDEILSSLNFSLKKNSKLKYLNLDNCGIGLFVQNFFSDSSNYSISLPESLKTLNISNNFIKSFGFPTSSSNDFVPVSISSQTSNNSTNWLNFPNSLEYLLLCGNPLNVNPSNSLKTILFDLKNLKTLIIDDTLIEEFPDFSNSSTNPSNPSPNNPTTPLPDQNNPVANFFSGFWGKKPVVAATPVPVAQQELKTTTNPASESQNLQILELDLSNSFKLKKIPDAIPNMKLLKRLNLSFCLSLERFEPEICVKTSLEWLSFKGCSNLKEIVCPKTQNFKKEQLFAKFLPKLVFISLENCEKLNDPPKNVIEKGSCAILTYFGVIRDQNSKDFEKTPQEIVISEKQQQENEQMSVINPQYLIFPIKDQIEDDDDENCELSSSDCTSWCSIQENESDINDFFFNFNEEENEKSLTIAREKEPFFEFESTTSEDLKRRTEEKGSFVSGLMSFFGKNS